MMNIAECLKKQVLLYVHGLGPSRLDDRKCTTLSFQKNKLCNYSQALYYMREGTSLFDTIVEIGSPQTCSNYELLQISSNGLREKGATQDVDHSKGNQKGLATIFSPWKSPQSEKGVVGTVVGARRWPCYYSNLVAQPGKFSR